MLEQKGYTSETIRVLGKKYDESIAAPAVKAIREKIESVANAKEVDLDSPEAVDKIIEEIISGSCIEDFRGFKYGNNEPEDDPELARLI